MKYDKYIHLIDEYLQESDYIDTKWVECLSVCKNLLKKQENLNTESIDLINRQKAEIERLEKNIDGLNIFTKNHIKVIRLQAKLEVIKEFAERLKCGVPQETGVIRCADVDNLVKEMTEVQE